MSSPYRPIATATPLCPEKLSDISHLKACHEGFGRNTHIKASDPEILAVRQLAENNTYRARVRSYQNQLLWLYAMHPDTQLAPIALASLAAPHRSAQGFEHLKFHHQQKFLKMLLLGFNTLQANSLDSDKNATQLKLKFTAAVAQRGLASADRATVTLAAELLHQLIKTHPAQALAPLNLLHAKQQFMDNLLSPQLQQQYPQVCIQFLTLILIAPPKVHLKHVELSLANIWQKQHLEYRFPHLRIIKTLFKKFKNNGVDSYGDHSEIVLEWRISLLNTAISDPRIDIRNFAEITLNNYLAQNSGVAQFIDENKIDYAIKQTDNLGNKIEFITVTRVQIHSRLTPPSKQHIVFYHQYKDVELGKKSAEYLIQFIDSDFNLINAAESHGMDLPFIKKTLLDMLTVFPFNMQRHLARIPIICNYYFDRFLTPGLPLHAQDAIKNVDWPTFLQSSSPSAIQHAKTYITKITALNPAMQDALTLKFPFLKNSTQMLRS